MSANLMEFEEDGIDASAECLGRMLEIAKTLLSGAMNATPSHAATCLESAREIHRTVVALLSEYDGHEHIQAESRRLDERLMALGH
jgi:hypothetical protein